MPDLKEPEGDAAKTTTTTASTNTGERSGSKEPDWKSEFESLSGRMQKIEENSAYLQRENEKLTSKSRELEGFVKKKGDEGDADANAIIDKARLDEIEQERVAKDEKINTLESEVKEHRVTNAVITAVGSKFSETPFAREALKDKINQFAHWEDGKIVFKRPDGTMLVGSKVNEQMSMDEFGEFLAREMPDIARTRKVNGVSDGGQRTSGGTGERVYTFNELAAMPDKGKSILKNPSEAQLRELANTRLVR
jgi:hypothetical protein